MTNILQKKTFLITVKSEKKTFTWCHLFELLSKNNYYLKQKHSLIRLQSFKAMLILYNSSCFFFF